MSAIEEKIMGTKGEYTEHKVMYYAKFHCELNYIEYFWCDGKSWTRRLCKYTIDEFKEDLPKGLTLVSSSTTLGHYKICHKNVDFYSEKVIYETDE